MTQYGIGVTKNRFELIDIDEEDPLELLKIREKEKEAQKKTKLSEKENKGKEPALKLKGTVIRKGIKETQNLKTGFDEAPKSKEDSKGKIERKTTNQTNDNRRYREERNGDFQQRTEESFRDRNYFNGEAGDGRSGRVRATGPRGGIGTRGARTGRGSQRPTFDVRGKREYDRQSGSDKTGVKPVDKREGGGAHNWGSHRDDMEDIQNMAGSANTEEITTWNNEKGEETALETEGVTVENEVPSGNTVEEELKELTLDEWKALKAPRQKPNFNVRKAGEGEDLTQWKNMYALQKKKEGEEEEEDEYEYETGEYPQRVGRLKHILDIEIHFKDNPRGRVRGTGRGMGGGGGGASRPGSRVGGGPRNPFRGEISPNTTTAQTHPAMNREKTAPKVDDERDFPSLG